MKPLKKFEDYSKEGVVKKQSPDAERAKFLITESNNNYQFLKELAKEKRINHKNANSFIKMSYDVLMEMVRAKMLLNGFNASGLGAHEAEVSYLRELDFSEYDIQFANQLRFFRNGIMYYGTILPEEYARKVLNFLNVMYPKLRKLCEIH